MSVSRKVSVRIQTDRSDPGTCGGRGDARAFKAARAGGVHEEV
jgi:hypothetical protein